MARTKRNEAETETTILKAVSQYTEPPAPKGELRKIATRRPLPAPVCEDPREELRRLVKLHNNWTRTAVALHHMSTDRESRETGETIPCLLPDFLRSDLGEAQKRLEATNDQLTREMGRALRQLPIWKWLGQCSGIAERTGAILVGETDIAKATKASSLKMFYGVCPSVNTGRLVRREKGQVNEYHAGIRTKLYQAFDSMPQNEAKLFADAPYGRTNKYLDIWHNALFGGLHDPRYDAKAKTWQHVKPDGTTEAIKGGGRFLRQRGMWKAVDIFVEDLYMVWRALEGLPVWPDWYAAKLGYMHGGKIAVREPRVMTYEEAVAHVGDVGWRPLAAKRTWKLGGED